MPFDPAKFLAEPSKGFDPNAFLGEAPTEKTTQGEAFLHNAAQGISFGTADELTGVASAILDNPLARKIREKLGIWAPAEVPVATTREGKPLDPPADTGPKSFGDAYRAGRDSAREDLDQTRKDWSKTALLSELGGAIFTPFGLPKSVGLGIKAGVNASKWAKAAADVGRTAARAGVEAAAYGAGSSNADVTKGQVGQFLVDTAKAGAGGAAIGGAGAAAGKLARVGAEKVVENLEQRVLNELAEGGPKSVGQKIREKLAKSSRAILAEVIEGPDAELVRKAMQQPKAEVGIKILQPHIDKVGKTLDEGYEAFRVAGKDIKPASAAAYHTRLMKLAQDPANSAAESKAIEQLADNWRDIVGRHEGTPVDLQRLRKFTTETQEAASAVSSDPSIREKLSLKLSRIASEAMDDMLSRAAKGDAKLEEAASRIRAHNERMNALLTIRSALRSRVAGEASGRSSLVRGAEKIATPAALLAGVGGLASALEGHQDLEGGLKRFGVGLGLAALGRALPAGARAIERGVTTRAINAVRAQPAVARTLRERLAEKMRMATHGARRFETYGKVAGEAAARRALSNEDEER